MGKIKKNKPAPDRRFQRSEWVGGRAVAPFTVTDEGSYRPEINLWLELPEGNIVHATLIDPNKPEVAFAETLRLAMESPVIGRPRRPRHVRVEEEERAAEIRDAFPEIPVTVAPTPEFRLLAEEIFRSFEDKMAEEEPSYFEGGRVSEGTVRDLFRASRALHALAPWKSAQDHQILRIDIPDLDVHAWCLSIIGALGESLGFLLFPSLPDFEAFEKAAESGFPEEGPIDLGSTILSLTFEQEEELPESMRREIAENGWPVAGPDAYPTVALRERDGFPGPLTERDVRIVASCASSLTGFLMKHGSIFREAAFDPICESWLDDDDLEVRFTAPYEAGPLFDVNQSRVPFRGDRDAGRERPKISRNAFCPCGSGKKYKKCCLEKDQAAAREDAHPSAPRAREARLVKEMLDFADERFGGRWFDAAEELEGPKEAMFLTVPWILHSVPVDGKTVAQLFIEERGRRLSPDDRAWLEASGRAWLSIWEAVEVEPGHSVRVRDLLSGEERLVMEKSGTEEMVPRDTFLARIVDHEGISLFQGMHPSILPPFEAAAVVERVRKRLRRKTAVPADRLRGEAIGKYMIGCWEKESDELGRRRSIPPELRNTDGDELLFTVDHFTYDSRDRAEVEKRLRAGEDVVPPEPDDPEGGFTFLRVGDPGRGETVLAKAVVSGRDRLRLETNSVKRADSMRKRVEELCGGLLRHRVREHSDPAALMKATKGKPAPPPPPPGGEAFVREFKDSFYRDWIDQSIPALGGRTPHEAIRTKEGRREVDLLLRDMENRENRLPPSERYDFGIIRRRLGLD